MRKSVEPIQTRVEAKPHRPVYRMHRYFARRPYSVFSELIRHYSGPNDVIMDPFCGGGVTLVEGALLGRRVIGFDINPLATFITRMELEDVDLQQLNEIQVNICQEFKDINDQIFMTLCRKCDSNANVLWFEYSAQKSCDKCSKIFSISEAHKHGVGSWKCPSCYSINRFSPKADSVFKLVDLLYVCKGCSIKEIAKPIQEDWINLKRAEDELDIAESNGLWIPSESIPDCNMQRESALFKKGVFQFRQLFTKRHLLALGLLLKIIVKQPISLQKWLLLAFSSTLRYTNRMATQNISWRGERPLEWAKPGFWLPPIHLEANVLEEFSKRCNAVLAGKSDYLNKLPLIRPRYFGSPSSTINKLDQSFHVSTCSATNLPIPDESIDVIITDPPYGSYVHYADLSNFWSVWLPEIDGMGKLIDNAEEAVISRKHFPGAKNAADYRHILEKCFYECNRVLKKDRYMVLTFHNREPRAWAALIVSATKAGFELPENGLTFQDGIQSYRHTAQSRRSGSIIGDFIFSFLKPRDHLDTRNDRLDNYIEENIYSESGFIDEIKKILQESGPLSPNELISRLYARYSMPILRKAKVAVATSEGATEKLIEEFNSIQLFDSHRRQLLEKYFCYDQGKWFLR